MTSDQMGCLCGVLGSLDYLKYISDAICPIAAPATDAAGGNVGSLAEAVMGITAGLVQIAGALAEIAEEMRLAREKESWRRDAEK